MATELLEMSTTEFLKRLNKYPQLGNITVLSDEDALGSHEDIQPGDICIYYDYSTESIYSDHAKCDEFADWLDEALLAIQEFMGEQGYELIDDLDGSGGGLHYGTELYRK